MANPYARLVAMLPRDPLLTGVVAATDGTRSTLNLIGGGTLVVRGTAPVGATVYHRAGVIDGQAETMTGGDIEV